MFNNWLLLSIVYFKFLEFILYINILNYFKKVTGLKTLIYLIDDMEQKWFVYLLECLDGSYYTGVTNDVDKRMNAHTEGKGSKYVYGKGFKKLIAAISCKNKSEACKTEYKIKQLSKKEKLEWFNNGDV